MRKIILVLLCLTTLNGSFACLNEYRTLLSGKIVYTDPSSGKIWHKQIDTVELKFKANDLLTAYKRSDSLEYYSDYAAALTYLGDYKKAKLIYEEIEQLSPNLYTTASNLGTIYELIGKPDSAIVWIKKSMNLNPDSHKGSEWIHIKILEFKLSGNKDFNKSILGLYFGNKQLPSNPNAYDLEELSDHIWHQLRERTTFVKPVNKIVGSIYFDLGNVLAQTTDVQAALESYEAAKEYGFESVLMNQRIEALKTLAEKAERKGKINDFVKNNFKTLFWTGLAVFIAVIILTVRIVKKKKRKGNIT